MDTTTADTPNTRLADELVPIVAETLLLAILWAPLAHMGFQTRDLAGLWGITLIITAVWAVVALSLVAASVYEHRVQERTSPVQ